jgi:competence protein ComEA
MATQGERRALFFLAAVAVLGAGTRACRSRRPPTPGPAIDDQIAAVDSLRSPGMSRKGRVRAPASRTPQPEPRVDPDLATAAEIERLPGIGPSLARRIVADREAHGPFRCLSALDRVKGVGPALLARLDTLVTFSLGGAAQCEAPTAPRGEGRPQR